MTHASSPASLVRLAVAAREAGDGAAARRLAMQAIAAHPFDRSAISFLVDLLTQQGAYDRSIAWLRRDLALVERPARTIQFLLFMLLHAGRLDEAARLHALLPQMARALPPGDEDAAVLEGLHRVVDRYRTTAAEMAFAPGYRVFDEADESREVRLWRKALTYHAEGDDFASLHHLVALDPLGGAPPLERVVKSDLDRLKARILADKGAPGSPSRPGRERFLVIRSHSSGFCADVIHSAVQLVAAELFGRTPLIYWGKESAYAAPEIDNLWNAFFEPVGPSLDEVARRSESCYPPFFTPATLRRSNNRPWFHNTAGASYLDILPRHEDVAVAERYCFLADLLYVAPDDHPLRQRSPLDVFWSAMSRIRLRQEILDEAKAWLDGQRRGKPVIAVHMRLSSSDKVLESLEQAPAEAQATLAAVDALLRRMPEARIFLMTDYQPNVALLETRYPDRVFSHASQRLDTGRAIAQRQLGLNATEGNYPLAVEVMRDVATGRSCDAFVGDGASNVSLVTAGLGTWASGNLLWTRTPNIGGWWSSIVESSSALGPRGKFVVY